MAASIFLSADFWGMAMKVGWPFLILLFLGASYTMGKKWPIEAIIFEKRGNNLIVTNDRAGRIMMDGFVHYKLLKTKDAIPIVNYDWVLHNVQKPTSFWEKLSNMLRATNGKIFLFRYGSKQYKPIKIELNGEVKEELELIKDKKGSPVLINVYRPVDPRKLFGELNFEVVDWDNMNFMVQEWKIAEERRKSSGDFWKQILLPLGALLVVAIICIFALKFSFDYADTVRTSGASQVQNTPDQIAAEQNANNPISKLIPAG
jgi:hypothetical protein